MRRLLTMLLLAGLLLVPTTGWAFTGKVRCTVSHFVRNMGADLRSASVIFNNGDPINPATIQRLTFWDFFGVVVHDSGPATAFPHPLNTDFPVTFLLPVPVVGAVDITVVPPEATYYLRTNHIWGNGSIGGTSIGNERGQALSVVIEFSKDGDPKLFKAHVRPRMRQLVALLPPPGGPGGFREGSELSTNDSLCFELTPASSR